MAIEIAVILAIAGMSAFFGAGEYEARDGGPNHRTLWAGLSLLISVLVLRWARAWPAGCSAKACC